MPAMPMPAPDLGPLTWSSIGHFQWSTGSLVLLVLVLGYAFLARRATLQGPVAWAWWKTACFLASMATAWLAINSVVGIYDMTLFSMHMVQHVLLVMVVAPLLAASAPLDLLRAGTSGRLGEAVAKASSSKLAEVVGHPLVGFLAYALLIPAFHLTHLLDQAMASTALHHLEQLLFVSVGYLFWRPVVAVEGTRHPLSPGLRLVYLLLAVPVDTVTGLALVMADRPPFVAFSGGQRHWGPTVLADLHQGGAIMWVIGDLVMMAAMIPVAIAWLRDEDRRSAEVDRQLDAGELPRESRRSAFLPQAEVRFPTAAPSVPERP